MKRRKKRMTEELVACLRLGFWRLALLRIAPETIQHARFWGVVGSEVIITMKKKKEKKRKEKKRKEKEKEKKKKRKEKKRKEKARKKRKNARKAKSLEDKKRKETCDFRES